MPKFLLPVRSGIFELHLWKQIKPHTNDLEVIVHSVTLINDRELKERIPLKSLSSFETIKRYVYTMVDGERLFSNAEHELRRIRMLYTAAKHYNQ